ncbi:MAG: hypothetical protein Q7S14_03445 [bacterium]|nr:hypothetical protein [bacterium]
MSIINIEIYVNILILNTKTKNIVKKLLLKTLRDKKILKYTRLFSREEIKEWLIKDKMG